MSAKRRSSKRSVSSKASRPEPAPLFVDRDAWSHKLGRALDEGGIRYVAHHQQFDSDSPDIDWIARAGERGWIAISRDQNIRRKPNELAAIRASRAIIFVFTSGNLSADDTARLLLHALPRIRRIATGAKRPGLFSIRTDGSIGRLKL